MCSQGASLTKVGKVRARDGVELGSGVGVLERGMCGDRIAEAN